MRAARIEKNAQGRRTTVRQTKGRESSCFFFSSAGE